MGLKHTRRATGQSTDQLNEGAHLLTQLILSIFRLNGQLISSGDALILGLGLTSARWQVLGAIASTPLTVPQIARAMGLTRQSVQRTANTLGTEGFLLFKKNPAHAKASLLTLTEKGASVLKKATNIQFSWSNKLAHEYKTHDLEVALRVAKKLNDILKKEQKNEI